MSKRELVSGVEQKLKQNKLLSCSAEQNVSASRRFFPPLSLSRKSVSEIPFGTWETFHQMSFSCMRNFGAGGACEKHFWLNVYIQKEIEAKIFWGSLVIFFYLSFLPKLSHIVQEFLKISILRCPRWGMQKHLLILETLAYSIQILAAVKKHNFEVDTVPKVFWQLFKTKSLKHVSSPSLNVLLYAL